MTNKKPYDIARKLTLAAIGALLCAGIYAATVRGLADSRALTARSILGERAETKRLPSDDELQLIRDALADARALEPSNPLFVEQLAQVHRIASLKRDGDASADFRQSLIEFRRAALMRPGSPYVWASIAALKLKLDEMDFEFYGALDRANRYGAWEPAIQLAVADIGLAAWRLLPQPAKTQVVEAIGRGILQQEKELRGLAEGHGTLGLVCADEAAGPAKSGLCAKRAAQGSP